MKAVKRKNVPKVILEELESCGLPFVFEYGANHVHIRVSGRLAGILPGGKNAKQGSDIRAVLNVRSQVRRIVAAVKEESEERGIEQ